MSVVGILGEGEREVQEDGHSHLGADGQLKGRYPRVGGHLCPVFFLRLGAALSGPVSSIIFGAPPHPRLCPFLWDYILPSIGVFDSLPTSGFLFACLLSAAFL